MTTSASVSPLRNYLSVENPSAGEKPHPGASALARLAANALSERENGIVTDLYMRAGMPVMYRAGERTFLAEDWGDESGVSSESVTSQDIFDNIVNFCRPAGVNTRSSFTRVFSIEKGQIRVQYSGAADPKMLVIRLLPLRPFPLEQYLGQAPGVIDLLHGASGLHLITGPIGAGKTSLGFSIAERWSNHGRHVAVVADPVEYFISTDKNLVSQFECALTVAARRPDEPYLADVIPDVLRCNVDAIYVSEARDSAGIASILELARTREPVITTFHAASIADAVIGVLSMAEREMGVDAARMMLTSSLEGIFWMDLMFLENQKVVPLVEFLPFNRISHLVKSIGTAEFSALKLHQSLVNEVKAPSMPKISIGLKRATEIAQQAGAKEAAISLKLRAHEPNSSFLS